MSEKGANIDLLFRNGLKDFEVLPPPGVWDGIHAGVKSKFRPVIFLRVAAVVTLLLTVSFLTYRWSREISTGPASQIAFNIPASSPVISKPVENFRYLRDGKYNQDINLANVVTEPVYSEDILQESEADVSPGQVMFIQKTKSLSIGNGKAERGVFLSDLKTTPGTLEMIKYQDLQYFPDNITPKPVNRWSIAAMASPTYFSNFNSGSDGAATQLMSSEQPLISYSGGLSFSYKISKRLSIQSGLYYSSLGQKVEGINSFSGFKPYASSKGDHNFEVLTSSGTVYSTNPDVFLNADGSDRILTAYTSDVFDPRKASLRPVSNSLNQSFSYLELPVVLRYKIVNKTLGINLIGGLSYNLLVSNSVYTTVDGNRYLVGDTKGLNPITLSSSLGMGMEYNFSDKLSLNLEPTFRYYLNSFNVTSGSLIHPYSFGIFSGVSYKF